MDIHLESTTFREALKFSAFLRQSADVQDEQKYDVVEECLDLLGMNPIADKIVRGSSVEQMKRLTIGVELATQPSVLFLDEWSRRPLGQGHHDGVRKVADTEIGKDACETVQFFDTIDGVAKLEPGYNPRLGWWRSLELNVGNSASQDFVTVSNSSEKKAIMDTEMSQVGYLRPTASVLTYKSKSAAANATQAAFVIRRYLSLYWRSLDYSPLRFSINIVLAVIFGASFAGTNYDTYKGINSGIDMIFACPRSSAPSLLMMCVPSHWRVAAYTTMSEPPNCTTRSGTSSSRPSPRFRISWSQLWSSAPSSSPQPGSAACSRSSSFGSKSLSTCCCRRISVSSRRSLSRPLKFQPSHMGCKPIRDLPVALPQGTIIKQYLDSVFSTRHDDL